MGTSRQDDVKGRVKEATGTLTGNDELKREGKIDQLAGKIKGAAEKVTDKVKDMASSGNDRHK